MKKKFNFTKYFENIFPLSKVKVVYLRPFLCFQLFPKFCKQNFMYSLNLNQSKSTDYQ